MSQIFKESHIEYRNFVQYDFKEVCSIYLQGIKTQMATFETTIPDWTSWNEKFLKNSRLVAVYNNSVIGWAALAHTSSRAVYAGVCDVSIYIDSNYQRKGIGKNLLKMLIENSESNNIWTLQAGIFAENIASIQLHLSVGFRIVGKREKIAKLAGLWKDTILLEKRSHRIQ